MFWIFPTGANGAAIHKQSCPCLWVETLAGDFVGSTGSIHANHGHLACHFDCAWNPFLIPKPRKTNAFWWSYRIPHDIIQAHDIVMVRFEISCRGIFLQVWVSFRSAQMPVWHKWLQWSLCLLGHSLCSNASPSVRVPVLSLQITEADPSVSTAAIFRTSTSCWTSDDRSNYM